MNEFEPIEVMEFNAFMSVGELLRKLREKHCEDHKIQLELKPARNMITVFVW